MNRVKHYLSIILSLISIFSCLFIAPGEVIPRANAKEIEVNEKTINPKKKNRDRENYHHNCHR